MGISQKEKLSYHFKTKNIKIKHTTRNEHFVIKNKKENYDNKCRWKGFNEKIKKYAYFKEIDYLTKCRK